jgi:SAM-dependent methyltransferase
MIELELDPTRYDTDKLAHSRYLQNYEAHFKPLADQAISLLELGVKNGGSLLLWRDYFKRGVIAGLDIEPVALDDPTGRIHIYQGAQQDTALLDRIAREVAPDGFDIIIDDCSHIGVLTRASFWHLFEQHLKRGGLYVIEDWGTGYWETWVDGARYKAHRRGVYSSSLYKAIRVCARLQHALRRVGPAAWLVSRVKSALLRRQYRSHNIGMVGFVKELIDECGIEDITNPEFGRGPKRACKFRHMYVAPSHLFIVKA